MGLTTTQAAMVTAHTFTYREIPPLERIPTIILLSFLQLPMNGLMSIPLLAILTCTHNALALQFIVHEPNMHEHVHVLKGCHKCP